jgi:hypothetical protein
MSLARSLNHKPLRPLWTLRDLTEQDLDHEFNTNYYRFFKGRSCGD